MGGKNLVNMLEKRVIFRKTAIYQNAEHSYLSHIIQQFKIGVLKRSIVLNSGHYYVVAVDDLSVIVPKQDVITDQS